MSLAKLVDEQDYKFLIDLADAAGSVIMAIYSRLDSLHHAQKADNSPLTDADLASNEIVTRGLSARWPQIPILSEETANVFSAEEQPALYWVVDPLDGTKEFIKGNDEFTVNIALVVNGVPEVGVVGAPALGLMYAGAFGDVCDFSARARKRDEKGWDDIRVSDIQIARPLRVAMSRSHPSSELADWLQQFPDYEGRDIGSSLKFCLVAEGVVDVYPRLGLTCIWDTAAGHALVIAAGGTVQNLDGENLTYTKPATTLNPFFVVWGNKSGGAA
ncbi:MAG: 3'(2'),5'-bisphosphate nucleotidase CysQ [Betaproteobacteria bacterium]